MNLKLNFCFTLVLLAAFAPASYGQRVKPPQNVLEYFMALPTKYFDLEQYSGKRQNMIKTQDIENGYLRLEFNGLDGYGEVALFKNTDGTKTLGIQTIGCGPVCETGSIFFVKYRNGRWLDVTKDVLPEISRAELNRVLKCYKPDWNDGLALFYELPRYGTTLKLTDNSESDDNLLYEFTWDGKKFTARAKRDKACREQ